MHFMKITEAGEYTRIQNYTMHNTESHRRKRGKRQNKTADCVKRYNHKMKVDKLQYLIMLNFTRGYFVTLKYFQDKHPDTYKAADKTMMDLVKGIKRECKQRGKAFKYIAVTERGRLNNALHHHIIVNSYGMVRELIGRWNEHGYIDIEPIEEDESAYRYLAEYICKDATKEELQSGKSSYHISRNLEQPKVTITISTEAWEESPKAPEGYKVLPDTVVNGFNESVGIKYQSYMIRRKREPKEHKEEQEAHRRNRIQLGNTFKKLFKKRPGAAGRQQGSRA